MALGASGHSAETRIGTGLYRSPNIARVIESKTLKCAGYEARAQKSRSALDILTGKHTEKISQRRPRILKEISCQCGIEPPGFIIRGVD